MYIYIYTHIYMHFGLIRGVAFTRQRLGPRTPRIAPYVGNPRSEEKHPECRFFLAHFMNPYT